MTCPCQPWSEIVSAVEGDVVAMGLPAEMGESSMMQLLGKGCIFQCGEHRGRYLVAEKSTLMHKADAFRQQAVKCPLCFEGRELVQCRGCNDGTCGHCTDGHVRGKACELCEGTGHVTYQQLILEEAKRSVTGWLNDAFSPVKSMARWADLRRHLRGVVVAATGLPPALGEYPPMLQLVDGEGRIQAELRGISWGYYGSGPRALAIILSDALPERFESYDAALTFAQRVPQDEAWTITP